MRYSLLIVGILCILSFLLYDRKIFSENTNPAVLISIISLLISAGSLGVVINKEFFGRADLTAHISRIDLIGMHPKAKIPMMAEIQAKAILAGADIPSTLPEKFILSAKKLKASKDEVGLIEEILSMVSEGVQVGIPIPDEILESYVTDRRSAPHYHTNLLITNSGLRTGIIASLVMIFTPEPNQNLEVMAFIAVAELDIDKFIRDMASDNFEGEEYTDFYGASVPPMGSVKLSPMYMPYYDQGDGKGIKEILPGKYKITVKGISADSKVMFESNAIPYELQKSDFISTIMGNSAVHYNLLEEHIAAALL